LEEHLKDTADIEKGHDVYRSDIDLSEIEIDEQFWEDLDNRHG